MAEESAKATPAETRKSGGSTFLMISAFMFVLLIMFNNDLRLATGRYVGYAFNPVASLWGFSPIWTIVFAGLVMIIGTTAIRHYLVDWVHQAKVQETMRSFQKEFNAARKSNNTYQIKRLTEQQPEIMKLQADMSSSQLRPMAFTMLLVIPIFAWLSTLTGAGVVYAHDLGAGASPVLLVAVSPDLQEAFILSPDGPHLQLQRSAEVYAYLLPGQTTATGTLTIEQPITHKRTTLDLSKAVDPHWDQLKVGTLPAGSYGVKPEGTGELTYGDHHTRSHVLLTVPTAGGAPSVIFVNAGGKDGRLENEWKLAEESNVYALIPFETGYTPTGELHENVRKFLTQPDGDTPVPFVATWTIKADTASVVPPATASLGRVVPHSAKLPWNAESDLNGSWWILPHWILLYSLISIPFGQVTQKALKLIEYRNVDLDDDGASPALNALR